MSLDDDTPPACTADSDCTGTIINSCFPKASCYICPGARVPEPGAHRPHHQLDMFKRDASATIDQSTGESTRSCRSPSRSTPRATSGRPARTAVSPPGTALAAPARAATARTPRGGVHHDQQQRHEPGLPVQAGPAAFDAPLGVTPSPLTTSAVSLTAADGNFCTAKSCADTGAPCSTDNDCTFLNPPSARTTAPAAYRGPPERSKSGVRGAYKRPAHPPAI